MKRFENSICLILIFSLLNLPQMAKAQVSSKDIQTLFEIFQISYNDELSKKNQSLVFNRKIGNFDWLDLDLAMASYVQIAEENTNHISHEITIVGGILKLKGFDLDAAALVLCHELGHGIGGPPYKAVADSEHPDSEDYLSSTEGQADYFASKECLPKIWNALPNTKHIEFPLANKKCEKRFGKNAKKTETCLRTFSAMRGFVLLRKSQSPKAIQIDFNSRDPLISRELNTDGRFYPTPQCRLDTLMAGALDLPRPECWYPSDFKNSHH